MSRSGPVNGVTSIHKADSSYQANGSTGRGSKLESDPAIYTGDKGDRPTFVERERPISKNVVKYASDLLLLEKLLYRAVCNSYIGSLIGSHMVHMYFWPGSSSLHFIERPYLPSGSTNTFCCPAVRSLLTYEDKIHQLI